MGGSEPREDVQDLRWGSASGFNAGVSLGITLGHPSMAQDESSLRTARHAGWPSPALLVFTLLAGRRAGLGQGLLGLSSGDTSASCEPGRSTVFLLRLFRREPGGLF